MFENQLILPVVSTITGFLGLALLYCKVTTGVCKSRKTLEGRTVIVTGASAGIGLETAIDLAARKARVIVACRDAAKGEKARKHIMNMTGNNNVILKILDVSNFKSVREFAEDILKKEERLDILVNNAGVMVLPRREVTVDGLETIMTTNHYGPFLLTNLLLPMLKKCAPSRIVLVSSIVHEHAHIDFDNLNSEKSFSTWNAYGMSKLANVLFTVELCERLRGTGVTVNALHPGVVNTELLRNISTPLKIIIFFLFRLFPKNAKQGAQTTIHVAVAEELEGVSGKYFSDCREKKLRKHARDSSDSKRLWSVTETITGLKKSN